MGQDNFIVELRHITKAFPGVVANDDISLQIRKGEIFALLGENGAGKSTLMSMLFGMYEPDSGEILVRGKRVRIPSPSDAVALEIGMVHQHFKLVQNYTVTENIILGMEPVKRRGRILPAVDLRGASERVRALSLRYGLEVDPDAVVETLNVSARQRVEILKMLYREAEILIFDEPTAVLTPQEITFLLEIIQTLRQAGKTVVLITHKLDEVKRVADRCAVLNRGRCVGVLNVPDTTTRALARMMVGRDIVLEPDRAAPRFGAPVLTLDGLTVTNGDGFAVVNEVSFTVRQGEIFAIAGVAGNGQTEIADAIVGLLPVTRGRVLLQGTDITGLSVRRRMEAGISYIPEDRQSCGLVLDFNLADNLAMRGYYRPPFCKRSILQREVFDRHAATLAAAYDIRAGEGGRTPVRAMSGGNQQKAIIAREIDRDAPLTVFVQPTRGLDIGAITDIRARMLALRDAGKAVLLISLDLDEIMTCADTIGILYNGKLSGCVPAAEISVSEVGEYMMGVKKS